RAGAWQSGRWDWSDGYTGENLLVVDYELHARDPERAWVRLRYSRGMFDYFVRLQQTRPHFGGVRWWFSCPVPGEGGPGGRRGGGGGGSVGRGGGVAVRAAGGGLLGRRARPYPPLRERQRAGKV